MSLPMLPLLEDKLPEDADARILYENIWKLYYYLQRVLDNFPAAVLEVTTPPPPEP